MLLECRTPLQLVGKPYWTIARVHKAVFAFIWESPRKQSFVLCFQNRYWSCNFMNSLFPPVCTLVLKIPMGLLCSFQQNLMWNTQIQQGRKGAILTMSELKGFTLMLRVELLVRDQTLVLCLKAALTFGKNSETSWKSCVYFHRCSLQSFPLFLSSTQMSLCH